MIFLILDGPKRRRAILTIPLLFAQVIQDQIRHNKLFFKPLEQGMLRQEEQGERYSFPNKDYDGCK
jgi:hypothetical protein